MATAFFHLSFSEDAFITLYQAVSSQYHALEVVGVSISHQKASEAEVLPVAQI